MTSSPRDKSWRDAIEIYFHRRVIAMLFLGFSAGLPFLLIYATLSGWLREAKISLEVITLFSWLGITFSIKVFWAPVIDSLALPFLTRTLGRRRSWMLLAQIGIAVGLLGIAASDPAQSLAPIAAFGILVAFSSATQDVSIDAYRIEAVDPELQGAMAATYQLGYRVALLMAGAGALYIADFYSWPRAYLTMAALVSVGLITVLIIREPEANRNLSAPAAAAERAAFDARHPDLSPRLRRFGAWFYAAVLCPFIDFFQRAGVKSGLIILAFIGLYRLSDIVMGAVALPFYLDLGFTKSEIATVTKLFGFFVSILGAFMGGLMVARYGLMRPLLLGAALIAITNLLFAVLAWAGADIRLLAVVISADNLSGGIAGSVFIAYLSSLTNTSYTATQYALFSSLMTLPGKFMGGFSGLVVESIGYEFFFIYAAALGLPAIALVIYLMHRGEMKAATDAATQAAGGDSP